MASVVTCSELGAALINWLNNATQAEKDALCAALACAADTGNLSNNPTTAPATTEGPALSTVVYGNRNATMGGPTGWIDVGGQRVPTYGAAP